MKATKKLTLTAMILTAVVLVLSLGASSIFAQADSYSSTSAEGRFYSDYSSLEMAEEAGEEFNLELASEGMVLLKNDGTLPLATGSKVSVLGVAQDCLIETSGTITDSLKEAGYVVNPLLEELYLGDNASSSTFGNETYLTNAQKQSMRLYSDLGVIVIARGTSGESSDRSRATGEADNETYLGDDQGWEHEAHTDGQKHELQLTASEEQLIKDAKQYCKKIVVLYSAAYTFEMANLEEDPDINAIAWIGRLGYGGIDAVGKMISGEINPSGKVVDEWNRDFTVDPTYANAMSTSYTDASGASSGYSGIEYEEDIYLGYKFYETYWYEASQGNASAKISGKGVTADQWYDYNVVYPFGYGLSYTSFSYTLNGLTADNGTTIAKGATVSSGNLASSVGKPATITTLYADVTVTNTGDMAGKETVEVYVNAPYTKGSIEKAYYTLAGYAKTGVIQPGKSETVTVAFNVQDFASFDAYDVNNNGHYGYELESGTYTIAVMTNSSHENVGTDAYADTTFTLSGTAYLDADDYSGNEITPLFTDTNADGEFDSMKLADDLGTVLLSRADFDGTMPTVPEKVALSADLLDDFGTFEYINADNGFVDEGMPWYKTDEDIPSSWTQETGVVGDNGMYAITLDDMAGIELYNADGTINAKWDEFMNQLTWEEIGTILNDAFHYTTAIPTIGKVRTTDDNGPNYTYNSTKWVGEPNVAATWNTELCEQYGMMWANTALWQGLTGWYGPGMNTHRSQFSGRTPEYYSQDGIQGGYIAAAVVRGATETGLNVYIKHFAMYDVSALYSTGCATCSEQNMRENYLKVFQMAMQEGGAHACMTAFNRIGNVYAGQNYALLQQLARDEWGWTGFAITDIYVQIASMTIDGLVRAGAELPDGALGSNDSKNLSGTWDASYGTNGGVLLATGEHSATQWYCARMSAMRVLYNEANSAGNNNGITSTSVSAAITVTQGQSVNEFVLPAECANGEHSIDSYTVTSGSLPEGISVSNGYVTGTALEGGNFTATVKIYVDGWIGITVNLTFEIDPIIELSTDLTNVSAGTSVSAYVFFDSEAIGGSTGSITYTISEGALPEGLSLDSQTALISGTPTTAGTYSFTIAVGVASGSGPRVTTTYYYLPYTITVTGSAAGGTEAGGNGIASMEINSNGELVVTYTDGTTQNLGKVVGADGKDGADGANGKDGADGSGCGDVVATDMIWMAAIVIVALAAVLIVRKARKDKSDR